MRGRGALCIAVALGAVAGCYDSHQRVGPEEPLMCEGDAGLPRAPRFPFPSDCREVRVRSGELCLPTEVGIDTVGITDVLVRNHCGDCDSFAHACTVGSDGVRDSAGRLLPSNTLLVTPDLRQCPDSLGPACSCGVACRRVEHYCGIVTGDAPTGSSLSPGEYVIWVFGVGEVARLRIMEGRDVGPIVCHEF